MIEINGHTISTIVVSTIMGHYGDGMFPLYFKPSYRKAIKIIRETGTTTLSKSSTNPGRIGNYHPWKPWTWDCIRDLPDMGMLNAYGLTNEGTASCAKGIKKAVKKGFDVIPNFSPDFGEDLEKTIQNTIKAIVTLKQILGDEFWALEINYSCPNDKSKIKDNIEKSVKHANRIRITFPWLTIIAKTSIVHPYSFLLELETVGVDILHLINTIPYNILFSGIKSPLDHLGGGGVSGGPAFEAAFKYIAGAIEKTRVPLIVGCGISEIEKFRKYYELMKDYGDKCHNVSYSVCTGLKRNTKEILTLINVYNGRK